MMGRVETQEKLFYRFRIEDHVPQDNFLCRINWLLDFDANAATEAAESALGRIRAELVQERERLARSAGEARREAWRYFGGFWVWLTAMLATGAFLGLLVAYGTETAKAALSVEDMVRYNCGASWFGGQVVEQEDGSTFCAFWLVRPDR